MQCKNYQPITLMNVAYKIFATILSNRLSEIMESKLGEYQAGFRPNRSTVDNIFILRQMYENCYEHNIELHNVFIDFNQAFDSINRSTIIQALKEMQIPGKIVRLVNMVTLTYSLLTPRCRVLPEQLTGLQLVKKFPAFHGTRRFITALTSVRHLSLTWGCVCTT